MTSRIQRWAAQTTGVKVEQLILTYRLYHIPGVKVEQLEKPVVQNSGYGSYTNTTQQ